MILHRYFARRYLGAFLGVLGVLFAILMFVDLIDQARRFGDSAGFATLLKLSALNLPRELYQILPLVTIIATLTMFLSLSRSSEMVVTRAAGRSALNALVAPVVVTLVLGLLAVAALNPIVASTSREYEARADALRGNTSTLGLTSDGLWLRQGGPTGQTVINAERTNTDGTVLWRATFITFDPEGRAVQRIAASRAVLESGAWRLHDSKVWPLDGERVPEAAAERREEMELASSLTSDQIRDSFGDPSSVPIWELPDFIARLEAAGFTARRHLVWLQMELALPVFLSAMVLIGAVFTLRHRRAGRTGLMVLGAILASFGAYFLRNFVKVLGENGEIPAALAAWAPPVAAIALALGLLLHLEDG